MASLIALVTGATSGLCRAPARLLAKEGWRAIIVTERSLDGFRTRPLSSLNGHHQRIVGLLHAPSN